MKLGDILSAAPGGRAQLHVAGYPATFLLPCNLRDFHEMGPLQRWFVGALTPAQVLRNGIAVNLQAMALADARTKVQRILHESCGHWYEMWKRMGPGDWPATYAWQCILTFGRVGSAHLHANHPQEIRANGIADAILAAVEDLLRVSQPVTFDTRPWLEQHFPALRP